jgi:multidrug resistance efflux pump
MELFITIAYVFLVRLIFFDFKLMRFNLFWKFVVFGLYAAAALTEITLLGQFTPYSKQMFVQSYVVQVAPEWGGRVTDVYVRDNDPVKKGDPLFRMDPAVHQNKVDQLEATLAAADTDVAGLAQQIQVAKAKLARTQAQLEATKVEYEMVAGAAAREAVPKLRLEQVQERLDSLEADLELDRALVREAQIAFDSEVGDRHTEVAEVLAELETARYYLENTTIRAPADGYVTNLQLHPGSFIRLKSPVMTFVSTEEYWVLAKMLQNSSQRVRAGDSAELIFLMYPGEVFQGTVESVAWGFGNAQLTPGGVLPREEQVRPGDQFFVRLRVDEDPDRPLPFGASGTAAIFTKTTPDFLRILRQLEIRMESYMNYLFNPF